MGLTLLFVTGARSEYGLARGLLAKLASDPSIKLGVLPHGMHMEKRYGFTIREIQADGFRIVEEIATGTEDQKASEFVRTVEQLHESFLRHRPGAIFLVGDRLETYGAALAAHFVRIPVIHSGGGHWTSGAVDNIYRFNISNLAELHLATSVGAYNRLCESPLISKEKVHLVGSIAVDQIVSFQANPRSIFAFVPELNRDRFALMTFHPVTAVAELTADLVQATIESVLDHGHELLVTFPNNDEGSGEIIEVLERNRGRAGVHLVRSLGHEGYLAAMAACRFVVGNSSSGIMEAPYFRKPVLNVGGRQDGREKDTGVQDIPAEPAALRRALEEGFRSAWPLVECHMLYGDGQSVDRAYAAIRDFLRSVEHRADDRRNIL